MRSVLRYFDLCRPVRAGTWFVVGNRVRAAAARRHAVAVMPVGPRSYSHWYSSYSYGIINNLHELPRRVSCWHSRGIDCSRIWLLSCGLAKLRRAERTVVSTRFGGSRYQPEFSSVGRPELLVRRTTTMPSIFRIFELYRAVRSVFLS